MPLKPASESLVHPRHWGCPPGAVLSVRVALCQTMHPSGKCWQSSRVFQANPCGLGWSIPILTGMGDCRKLAGVVLPRCVTAPNPRNMPDTFGRVLPIRKPARSRGHRPSCAGRRTLRFVELRTTHAFRAWSTPSFILGKIASEELENGSRNVFVTICTPSEERCHR